MKFWLALTGLQQRLLALLLVCVMVLLLYTGSLQQQVVNPLLAPLDEQATQVLKRSLLLSSASFATARLIDRGIAFTAEAQFSVGVASIKPGQMLKPLQDMAVRYSDLMVLAMTSIGLQLFMVEFGKMAALPLFGSGLVASSLLWLVGPTAWRSISIYLIRTFLMLLLLIRLGVPLAALGVAQLSNWVIEPQRQSIEAALSMETAPLQQVEQPLAQADNGVLAWLKQLASNANDLFNAVKHFSDGMIEKLIQLIVLYSLQTLIFPLISLYLLWQCGRWFVRRPLVDSTLQPLVTS